MLFERSITVVAVLATLAFLAAGVHAWLVPVEDAVGSSNLARHVLLGLASALLLVFPNLWVILYLWGTGRAVAKEVDAGRAAAVARERVRRYRRLAVPPSALVVVLALATVFLGQNALVDVAAWQHPALFAATLAAEAWALWAQRRALWGNAALMTELDAAPAGAPA